MVVLVALWTDPGCTPFVPTAIGLVIVIIGVCNHDGRRGTASQFSGVASGPGPDHLVYVVANAWEETALIATSATRGAAATLRQRRECPVRVGVMESSACGLCARGIMVASWSAVWSRRRDRGPR